MTDDLATEPRRRNRAGRALGVALLAILPPILSVAGFIRPPLVGDSVFYGYQLKRAVECGGRWWRIGDDPGVGHPYQGEVARHAGLYEGVDLMLLGALPGRWLDARRTYYFAAYAAIALNGWVAAWLVFRSTRSVGWAAAAVVLITWNYPTAFRMLWHLHLFKYGWALLATWAFSEYLRAPTVRRGLGLGAALALAFQGSFYLGYFLLLGLGTWWLGSVVAGRVGRGHLRASAAAGLAAAAGGAALTFPVWTTGKAQFFADDYFHRSWAETWKMGAELWQYLLPQLSSLAIDFRTQVHAKAPAEYDEGGNFPGFTILLAVALYLIARLRGRSVGGRPDQARFLGLLVGLMGVFVVMSLAGGPSMALHKVGAFAGFRCYGRAGLLALAAGCVAAPMIYHDLIGAVRSRALRGVAVAAVAALMINDARLGLKLQNPHLARELATGAGEPAWVDWLAGQPRGVRLAAFAPSKPGASIGWWGIASLGRHLKHGHATLNGCDLRLFQGDLALLGATYDRMNPAALRFVVALGYETLAFRRDYLDANPFIRSLPWLDRVDERGDWLILRANPAMPPYRMRSLRQLLADQPAASADAPAAVPARTWITGRLAMDRDTVVPEATRVFLAWADASGERVGEPMRALFQHAFGPSIPAFRALTPKTSGDYDLLFLDDRGRRLASRRYRVELGLATSHRAFPGRLPEIPANEITAEVAGAGSGDLRVSLRNAGGLYLQAIRASPGVAPSVSAHPGLASPGAGSLHLWVRTEEASRPAIDQLIPLPGDLPPGGSLTIDLPADRLTGVGASFHATLAPVFAQYGRLSAPAGSAEMSLSLLPVRGERR